MSQILASLKDIQGFFEMSASEFASEWKVLSDEDKIFFKAAVAEAIGKKE